MKSKPNGILIGVNKDHASSIVSRLLFFLLVFTLTLESKGQNITSTIGSFNSSGCAIGDTISVPVTVSMASGISVGAISIAIDFDTTKVQILGNVTNLNSNISAGFLSNVTSFSNQSPNPPYTSSVRRQFRAAWFNLAPISFNGLMFNLRVVVIASGSSLIKWDTATLGNAEYADELAEIIPNCVYTNGTVNCQPAGSPCGISLSSASGTNAQTVTVNTAITNITYSTTGATGATISGLPSGVTGSWASNAVTISGTPAAPGTFNYTVSLTGCSGGANSVTGSITVNSGGSSTCGISLSSASGTNAQTVTVNTAITNITYSTTGATGATISGLPAGVTGSWASNAVTISGTPTATGTFNYTVTLSGCTGGTSTATGVLTVNAGGSGTSNILASIGSYNTANCAVGDTITVPVNIFMASGISISAISMAINYDSTKLLCLNSVSGLNQGIANGFLSNCGFFTGLGASQTGSGRQFRAAWFNLSPVVLNGLAFNLRFVVLTPGNASLTWDLATPGVCEFADEFADVVPNCNFVSGSITCGQFCISLASSPLTQNQTLCSNSAIQPVKFFIPSVTGVVVNGLPQGVNYIYSGDTLTISGTSSVPGTYRYGISLVGSTCTGALATDSGTLRIQPTNSISLISGGNSNNLTVCRNSPIPLIKYKTTGASNASVTGLPSGLVSAWSNDTLIISGSPNVAFGTFTYRIYLTGGCGNSLQPIDSGTILVKNFNSIALISAAGTNNQTRCTGSPITLIRYRTTNATGATFTGLPSGVVATWINDTVSISGSSAVPGTFSYTVTLTGGCPGATGNSATGTLTINQVNTINLSTAVNTRHQTICRQSPLTLTTYNTTGSTSGTIAWTPSAPAGISATWISTPPARFSISGTPTAGVAPGTYSYRLNMVGGCAAPVNYDSGSITINVNTISLASPTGSNIQTVCSGTGIAPIVYRTNGATGANFANLPAGVNGVWANDTVRITGAPTSTTGGIFNYTVNMIGGCSTGQTVPTGTITVNSTNSLTLSSAVGTNNQVKCIGTPITNITYNVSGPTGVTGVVSSGLPIGVTATINSLKTIVTVSGSSSDTGIFNYSLGLSGGCNSVSNVLASGSLNFVTNNIINTQGLDTNSSQTVCVNSPIIPIAFWITGAAGATVSGLPPGLTGQFAANSFIISGIPSSSGSYPFTVTLTGGCTTGISTKSGLILVNPLGIIQQVVNSSPTQNLCLGGAISDIEYVTSGYSSVSFSGLPPGVSYQFNNNQIRIFGTPTDSGLYAYQGLLTGSCPDAGANTITGTIGVRRNNVLLISGSGTDSQETCIGSSISSIVYRLSGPTSYTVTGLPPGISHNLIGNELSFVGTPTSVGTFSYQIDFAGGCPGVNDFVNGVLKVKPPNTISLSGLSGNPSPILCRNTPLNPITLVTSGATGAVFSGLPTGVSGLWRGDSITISGVPISTGVYTYTVSMIGGCSGNPNTFTGTMTVNALNSITLMTSTATLNQIVCLGTPISPIQYQTTGATGATFSNLPNGVTGSWVADSILLTGIPTDTGSFNVLIQLTGGCNATSVAAALNIRSNICGIRPSIVDVSSLNCSPGDTVEIPVGIISSSNYQISGAQLSILFNQGQLQCLSAEAIPGSGMSLGNFYGECNPLNPGLFDISWDGNPTLFNGLQFKLKFIALVSGTSNLNWVVGGANGSQFFDSSFASIPNSVITYVGGRNTCIDCDSPTVVFNIQGATTFCQGGSILLSVQPVPNCTYRWLKDDVILSGQTANTLVATLSGHYRAVIVKSPTCSSTTQAIQISVVAANSLTIQTNAGSVNQNVCLFAPISPIQLNLTGSLNYTASGLPPGTAATLNNGSIRITGNPSQPGIYNYFVLLLGGCSLGNDSVSGRIVVNSINSFNLVSSISSTSQVLCNRAAIIPVIYRTDGATGATFLGLPPGVNGYWDRDTAFIIGSPSVIGVYQYTISFTGGCPLGVQSVQGSFTVNPGNVIGLGSGNSTQTVCANANISTIYYYTLRAVGATITGLPPGVSGFWRNDSVVIQGSPSQTGVFKYMISLVGGCSGSFSGDSGIITVNNHLVLKSPPSSLAQEICINTPIAQIELQSNGASGVNVSGLPPGVSASFVNGNIAIVGTPSQSGIFPFEVTLTGGCSTGINSISGFIRVKVNSVVLMSSASTASQSICIGSPINSIQYVSAEAIGVNVTGLPTGTTWTWNNNLLEINGTPTNVGNYNYTITLSGGCPNQVNPVFASGSIVVRVNNNVSLISSPGSDNQSICILTALTPIRYSTTGATGVVVLGLPAGVTGNWANNLLTISGNPTQTGVFPYQVVMSGGCTGGSTSVFGSINISSNLIVATNSTQLNPSFCVNDPILTLTYSTVGATGATVTGLPSGLTSTWANNLVSISGTTTQAGSFPFQISLTGGCPNDITRNIWRDTLTIKPYNSFTLLSPQFALNQSVCVNSPITNLEFTLTSFNNVLVSNLPRGVTYSVTANHLTVQGTPLDTGNFSFAINAQGGCSNLADFISGSIRVNPYNNVELGIPTGALNQTVCAFRPIDSIVFLTRGATGAIITGLPSGVSGLWRNDTVVIKGSSSQSGQFNFSVSTTGGCASTSSPLTGQLNITPENTIQLVSPSGSNQQTVCIGYPIDTINYITSGYSNVSITGLPSGLSWTWSNGSIQIIGVPSQFGDFPYRIELNGGCLTGMDTITGVILVRSGNTLTLISSPGSDSSEVCQNANMLISYMVTSGNGATVNGLPAGVNSSYSSGVLNIQGAPTTPGIFPFTVTTVGGCDQQAQVARGVIRVSSRNTISLVSNQGSNTQNLCLGEAINNIFYATNGPTGVQLSGLPPGVTGNWANNQLTISGSPQLSGTFNYLVTLTGGCTGGQANASGIIVVNPSNLISLSSGPVSQSRCLGSQIVPLLYVTNGATGAVVTGLPPGVTGVWSSNTILISGTTLDTGVFTFAVTTIGGCNQALTPLTGQINVLAPNSLRLISPSASTQQSICIGFSLDSIVYRTTGATGAVVSGLPAGVSYNWNNEFLVIYGSPLQQGNFQYTVTTSGGCAVGSQSLMGNLVVRDNNSISLTSASGTTAQSLCINSPIQNITYSTSGATGVIFNNLPPGITGLWSNNTAVISGVPTSSGAFNYSVTMTGGCNSISNNIGGTIQVTPAAVISLNSAPGTLQQSICLGSSIIPITYVTSGVNQVTFSGLPQGVTGVWNNNAVTISGTPLQNGIFSFAVSIQGVCLSSNFSVGGSISVNANQISLSSPLGTDAQSVCQNQSINSISYNTVGATGAVFLGLPSGVVGTWINNSVLIFGTPDTVGVFQYQVSITGGCPASQTVVSGSIVVRPFNSISLISSSATNSQQICLNSPIDTILYRTFTASGVTVSGLPPGLIWNWTNDILTISGSSIDTGLFIYRVDMIGGCVGSANSVVGSIRIKPFNTLILLSSGSTMNQTICSFQPISNIFLSSNGASGANVSGLPTGLSGQWINNTYTISGSPTSTGIFNFTIQLTGGCPGPQNSLSGTLNVRPRSGFSYNDTICDGGSLFFGNRLLSVPGVYRDTLMAWNGCDSLITLNLIVLPKPLQPQLGLSSNRDSLFATPGGPRIQWFLDGLPIGQVGIASLPLLTNGNYQAIRDTLIFGKICNSDTSTFVLTNVGNINWDLFSGINIFPVPCSNFLNIVGLSSLRLGTIKVFDLSGRIVEVQRWSSFDSGLDQYRLDLSELDPGMYFLMISDNSSLLSKSLRFQIIR